MVANSRVLAWNIDGATLPIAQVRSADGALSSPAEQTCTCLATLPAAGLVAARGKGTPMTSVYLGAFEWRPVFSRQVASW